MNDNTTSTCHLHTHNADYVHDYIRTRQENGIKLLEITLTFEDYWTNPLRVGTSENYKLETWHRTFSRHGQTLLTLPFDYKMLSLTFLSFGTEEMTVGLIDAPQCCFAQLPVERQIEEIKTLFASDFQAHPDEPSWLEPDDSFCHQFIEPENGVASFKYECCSHSEDRDGLQCRTMPKNKWIEYLYTVINIMDALFFLFGPLLVVAMFASRSFRVTEYIVQLTEPHVTTVKKNVISRAMTPRSHEEIQIEASDVIDARDSLAMKIDGK